MAFSEPSSTPNVLLVPPDFVNGKSNFFKKKLLHVMHYKKRYNICHTFDRLRGKVNKGVDFPIIASYLTIMPTGDRWLVRLSRSIHRCSAPRSRLCEGGSCRGLFHPRLSISGIQLGMHNESTQVDFGMTWSRPHGRLILERLFPVGV